jgi:hypothetical protein
MTTNALDTFIAGVRAAWGPLTSERVAECRRQFELLLRASPLEDWLLALHRDKPASRELYRDPDHGFVLLAHTEHAPLYRAPHDHGRGWVMYGVQSGEMEMCTYARVLDPDDQVRLVQRDSTTVHPGQVQVYLPSDIHDTQCLTASALQFRFTDRDLKVEDKVAHRLTRYVQRNGFWTMGAE